MLRRQQACLLQISMNRLSRCLIGYRGSGRSDMGNQVGELLFTCFSEMDFVAGPARLALLAVASFLIVGRINELFPGRKIVVVSPMELTVDPDIVLYPNTT